MKHEEMMSKAWRFIQEAAITENPEESKKNNELYLVENIYQVRDAFCEDLENGISIEDEELYQFLDRHGIKWE